jgi:hypothetical protein
METGYKDHAELTREFYRKQGENRKKQEILKALEELKAKYPTAIAFSPSYLIEFVRKL